MMEILVRPIPMQVRDYSGVLNPDNVLNERLGRTATTISGGAAFVFDMASSATTFDTIAVLATDSGGAGISYTATLHATLSDAQSGANPTAIGTWSSWASSEAGKRIHRSSVFSFPQVTGRWLRLYVSADLNIGRIIVGKKFTPIEQRDYDWDFKVVDLGEPRRSSNGLDDPTIRGKVMEYSWSWSGLTQAEARGTMLDLLAYAGNTRDLLVCLDDAAADKHNLIGYGRLTDAVTVPNTAEDWYTAKFTLQSRLILSL